MKFLHTMIRVLDLDKSIDFYTRKLGLSVTHRYDVEAGRFTLVFLGTDSEGPQIELTHNWDNTAEYLGGRNFGHLAYRVKNIYALCQKLMDSGVTISRPPRDGHMAFVKCPDGISIELLQANEPLPKQEPWASMENTGSW